MLLTLLMAVLLGCGQTNTSDNSGDTPAAATTVRPLISADPKGPARIELQIAGLGSGEAKLAGTFGDQNFLAATTSVDATGRMVFEKAEGFPAGFYFVILADNSNIQLLIDTDNQVFSLKARKDNIVGSMQISNSIDNELLYQTLKAQMEDQPKVNALIEQLKLAPVGSPEHAQLKQQQDQLLAKRDTELKGYQSKYPNALFTKFKVAGQNPPLVDVRLPDGSLDTRAQVYRFRTAFWEGVDFADERLIRTPVIHNKLRRYILELTSQHPDSINKSADFLLQQVPQYPAYYQFFSNWITLQYEPDKTTLMDPQAVFVHMVQTYFTQERAFWSSAAETQALQLRAHEMAQSLVGQKGPDVQAPGPDGKLRSIYEIKAPYIAVYMFDPNCDNCQIETPKLRALYQTMKDQGLEVFGIVLNTNDQEWKQYIAKNQLNWINVFDPTNKSIYAKYYVDHTPELYLLNPDRTIIAKNLKAEQLVQAINLDKAKRQ